MVVILGVIVYFLIDCFGKLLIILLLLGGIISVVGVYVSYYIDGVIGGCIVVL